MDLPDHLPERSCRLGLHQQMGISSLYFYLLFLCDIDYTVESGIKFYKALHNATFYGGKSFHAHTLGDN